MWSFALSYKSVWFIDMRDSRRFVLLYLIRANIDRRRNIHILQWSIVPFRPCTRPYGFAHICNSRIWSINFDVYRNQASGHDARIEQMESTKAHQTNHCAYLHCCIFHTNNYLHRFSLRF
ncbi:hypothetical protein PMAYCL1PPCAC_20077 [Pristionchus mayeri]|uniref:Uncharacterized protein n=1 Tax=Pristionchus mayeri TaxID=1317129 RepID=A0AAN5CTP5_9BILA|nr:hypothetical protein PMAYCL1PPCAC_20077 [Pristionchus mayeri]